ncbi:dTDP-4-dehydrorhamnose reductase [Zooshikella harenae]|uniref:dTDP-4-dehydrorhamnose reductase n=1 Tax=Zooshikella harenae TaxID=2827238 RepID=A0ABS5Z9X8_9GAMM|nr:dTDP-4-dehydrorhamnose reductase [Zooshikella harenae]MBU2710861.1 dTDP-4-dehydrorhamnose reductase [Zooshikella harenae]
MNKKILLTGADGQLGQSILRESSKFPSFTFIPTDQHNLDITNPQEVNSELDKIKPDYIINTAAYTNVDSAESDYDTALAINSTAVHNLAVECKKRGIFLVHFSTDYVFSGEKKEPYNTHDKCAPLNVYGKTKWLGEQAINTIAPQGKIIRTSWLFSIFNRNFVKTIIEKASAHKEIRVISDQLGQPTSAHDLAYFTLFSILQSKNDKMDTIHFSNQGACSWYELAKEIVEEYYRLNLLDYMPRVMSTSTNELTQKATRPAMSVLSTKKTEDVYNIVIRDWRSSLSDVLITLSFSRMK